MDDKTILLVEDNPDDEALALRAFQKNNIHNKIVVAHNGVEALDYLFGTGRYTDRNIRVLPQFILLDLKLPMIDGLDVLRRMRADWRTRLIPVVILTSSVEARDLHESYSLGANSYIRKPVDYLQFNETVRNLAHYWLDLNVGPPR